MTSTIIRYSSIPEDIGAIVASWGPDIKDVVFLFTVRGIEVSRLRIVKEDRGRMYRLCVFPDFTHRWVNEGNLVQKRIARFVGET